MFCKHRKQCATSYSGLHCLLKYPFIGDWYQVYKVETSYYERGGAVVDCLTLDRGVAGTRLTGGTASTLFRLGSTQKDRKTSPA